MPTQRQVLPFFRNYPTDSSILHKDYKGCKPPEKISGNLQPYGKTDQLKYYPFTTHYFYACMLLHLNYKILACAPERLWIIDTKNILSIGIL